MFSLDSQKVTLAHLNVRPENHGDEKVGGADLKIAFTESNGLLAMFHPVLRDALYRKEETPPNQEEIFQGSPADQLTVRKFGDLICPLRLKYELKGASVVIGFGLGGASNIDFETADVDHFSVELMEGGSARYGFRVKCNPTGEQIKRLYEVLGGEVDITVTPAVDKQGSLLND
ncbi:hypothetical protein RVU96_10605 [Bordetella avium]|uniref:hypothetical protein n=1 Tax=Bordetella avium TaxID=521 RepID=UPI000E09E258|nr:hypothetical protein [Bordetella avium]RIQ11920.1 hypothetical protein D0432_14690 [Bordetella avium]RIQ47274.1 hypothetical protein D0845_14540 [Bordetella avium]RIQ51277.1 hypothetical protein D0844_14415 [Bordetella avium]RIQ57595.1 hypothetical protein D0842_17480 [Bordetella avium]RIQ60436.1 hypothetical protein D0840_14870 [Bordetella avium]